MFDRFIRLIDSPETRFNPDGDDDVEQPFIARTKQQTRHSLWTVVVSIIAAISTLALAVLIWRNNQSDENQHVLSPSVVAAHMVNEYRQAVLTMATGYHIQDIHPFLASFRAHHPYAQLVVIVKGSLLTDDDRDAFCYYNAQALDIEPVASYYPVIQQAALRMLIDADILANRTPFNASVLEDARQLAYNRTCRTNNEHAPWRRFGYDVVAPVLRQPLTHAFLCDSRDLLFQGNLMRFLPYDGRFHPAELGSMPISDALFAFAESVAIDQEHFNRQWLNCIQPNFTQLAAPKSMVVNSGQVLGSVAALLALLSAMSDAMQRITHCDHLTGIDQGFYNWVIHGRRIPNVRTFIIPHDLGPVLAMHTMQKVRRSPYGAVVNENNEVYAVLHQYDRWDNYFLPRVKTTHAVYSPSRQCINRQDESAPC